MRKREKAILCWLNEKEYEHLKKQAGTSGLTVSALIRKLIMGQEIRQRPPAEMPELLRQMSAIGNNINQIAVRVNSTNKVYAEDIVNIKEGQDKIWQLLNSLQSKLLRLKR